MSADGNYQLTCALTNNLIERSSINLLLCYMTTGFPFSAYIYNNLFHNSSLTIDYANTTSPCAISDNFFDTCSNTITIEGPSHYSLPASFNGFKSTTTFGTSSVTITVADYQVGPLSPFYYPSSGVSGGLTNLVNTGSRTAAAAGLSSYSTTTNQVADSGIVDIGAHFFALNTNAVVSIFADDPDASETGPDPGEFTVSRFGSTTSALNVFYTIGGLAINGTDYASITNMVTKASVGPSYLYKFLSLFRF